MVTEANERNARTTKVPGIRIIDWRVLLITFPLEASLLILSFIASHTSHATWHLGLFADALVFYAVLMVATIITLKIIRVIFPPAYGRFTQAEHPQILYIWGLLNFLSATNLFLHYQCSLLPTVIRKFFSRLLGAKIGKGLISIGGLVVDPYAITIEEEALIGHEALLLPHTLAAGTLVLRPITVGRGAVVGGRSILMPGVTLGEGSMVKAMSVVAEGTNIPPYEVWGGIPARKMGEQSRPDADAPRAFSGWRDMIISPAVETVLLGTAGYAAWIFAHYFEFGLFGGVLLFYGALVLLTLITLKLLRSAFPFQPGRYSFKEHPWICYRWSLHGFLCTTNLFLHFQNGLISPMIRRLFSRMLGASIKDRRGFLPMSGLSTDPYMLKMETGSIICNDAVMVGHVMTRNELIISPVEIGANAVVDLRAFIMPGVTIGQGARVGPLSLVTTGTKINPGEIWLGVPARKIGGTQCLNAEGGSRGFKPGLTDIIAFAGARIVIFVLAALTTAWLSPLWWDNGFDGFAVLMVFHFSDVLVSLALLWILRTLFEFRPGTYTQKDYPEVLRLWGVYGMILTSNLKLYYLNALLPPHCRTFFLRLLGLRTNNDFFLVGGLVLDPYLVRIGDNSLIGYEALISPIQLTGDSLIMGQVNIGDRVSIGARAIILPNVTIGDNAVVEVMSVVMAGTTIPPFEIWAGIPAKKVGELV